MPYKLAIVTSHAIQYQAPLFRALSARPELDVEVFFCSRWGAEPYADPEFGATIAWDVPLLEGYRHRFLKNLGLPGGPTRFLGIFNPALIPAIVRGGFDAVWIHGWALASNWIAWSCAAARRIPLLLRGESNGLAEPDGLRGAIKRITLGTFFSKISAFLAIGSHNRKFYARYGVPPGRVFEAPYAVDNDFFLRQAAELAPGRRELREAAGIQPDLPVILYAGKVIDKKRPFDLLRAFESLSADTHASLAIVGDGALRPALEKFARDRNLRNVHFPGFRNQSEIGSFYAMADVFVLPSGAEPWGLAVNEAMCFGLPVVVSDRVGAAPDLVEEGVNGFTYPCGDAGKLAGALRTVLARKGMGERSREIIRNWGIGRTVDGVLRALASVA